MIRRRCTERHCKNGRRCLEHLRFDVMWRGKRYRMPVNDFAIPRMDSGKQRPIQSMEEARDWERLFIGGHPQAPVDLGPDAYVFGTANGTYQPNIQTAWETLRLLAYGVEPKPGKEGATWNQEQLRRIDLRWHDLRHEGACRLLADGVDIRIIQLMLGHASIQQTQRYLNVTDEELRRGLEVNWKNQGRPLRLASGS